MSQKNTNTETVIRFEKVSCHIGKSEILKDISLSINKGTITGILGPNGAGKSTLLSIITGLRTKSSGQLTVLGQDNPSRSADIRRRIGVVLQETALYDELSTFENLNFSAALYNVPDAKKKITAVLGLLELSDRAHANVQTLSGGLRRRVAIARAFLHDPELLIIDEPTLGVDVEARHAIWSHLRLLRAKGRTILVATNYLDEAQALCDEVIVLNKGAVVAIETPQKLVSRVGSCIDLTCNEKESRKIETQLKTLPEINRIEQTPSGLSIFIKGDVIPEKIISIVMKHAHINEFKVRSPDLAEVFKALQEKV
jgi:ABC-type multidrug transport system ATPase subunit